MTAIVRQPIGNYNANTPYRPYNFELDPNNGLINQKIPTEVLLGILQYLTPSELPSARQTCRYWEYLIADFAPKRTLKYFDKLPLFRGIADQFESSASANEKINQVWGAFRNACISVQLIPPVEHPMFLSSTTIEKIHNKLLKKTEGKTLLRFCRRLPEWVKEELPSLSLEKLPSYVRAERLRDDLEVSGIVDNLDDLDMSSKHIDSLPPEISLFSSLVVLNLSGNQIIILPDEIGDLWFLQELHLTNNEIDEVPLNFQNLIQLRQLSLNSNKLIVLPDIFSEMKELEELYLDHNQIQELPDNMQLMENLTTLTLNDNLLESVPEALGDLPRLTTLNLKNNPLNALPDSLKRFEQVDSLEE